MPAAVRGGSRAQAKPRTKGSASPARPRNQAGGRAGYTPGKLGAAQGLGLSPQAALTAAGGVLALAFVITLSTGHRAEKLGDAVAVAVGERLAGMGLKLKAVHVEGASPMAREDILRAAGVGPGAPMIGLDLEAVRQRIEQVGWVKEARIVRLLPDTLVLVVTERRQLAVWQNGGRTVVIDEEGHVIPEADSRQFPQLPLIVGEGANDFASQILPEVASRPRLMGRLEALVRVDNRRWDLRLKDGSLVQLPAVNEEAALILLEKLDERSRILELGFERIDLRDPDTVAVRPREGSSAPELPVAGGA